MNRLLYCNRTCLSIIGVILVLPIFCLADESTQSEGLFIEPSVTYEMSSSSINYPSPLTDSTGSIVGLGLGARFGLHIKEVLFFGIDARYSRPKFEDSSTNYNSTGTSTNWGPVFGVQMPVVGMRIWGTYVLGGELNPQKSGNYDLKFSQADGYRLGAGFRIAAVSLNLEYQNLEYKRSTLEQVGPFTPSANFDSVNLKNKSWLASVSFPAVV